MASDEDEDYSSEDPSEESDDDVRPQCMSTQEINTINFAIM